MLQKSAVEEYPKVTLESYLQSHLRSAMIFFEDAMNQFVKELMKSKFPDTTKSRGPMACVLIGLYLQFVVCML